MKSGLPSRRVFLGSGVGLAGASMLPRAAVASAGVPASGAEDRTQWLRYLQRVSEPVLAALGRRELRKRMPVEAVAGHEAERAVGSPLEALGRLLAGLAPWLELDGAGDERERALRERYCGWAREAIASAVDPKSPDYMRFGESAQTLVDSSFLSLAILRSPKHLLGTMSADTKAKLVAALEKERTVQSPYSNWLLFAALNEVLLLKLDAAWDRMRVDYALHSLENWYVGDGTYGDGPDFHADFYNSYVMHPYLLSIADGVAQEAVWQKMFPQIQARARRYAAIQERVIGPEGTFPVLGRSLAYRAGAFHLLADVSRRGMLPEGVAPGRVRAALTAVQRRTLEPQGTFTADGWLQIGLAGHQPSIGETYISTGSLYLCSVVWLPLGLAPEDPFWSAPAADWTQKAAWAGGPVTLDHAMGKG